MYLSIIGAKQQYHEVQQYIKHEASSIKHQTHTARVMHTETQNNESCLYYHTVGRKRDQSWRGDLNRNAAARAQWRPQGRDQKSSPSRAVQDVCGGYLQ